jgi:hypothetical protein
MPFLQMGQATMNFGPLKMAVLSLGPVNLTEALTGQATMIHEGSLPAILFSCLA